MKIKSIYCISEFERFQKLNSEFLRDQLYIHRERERDFKWGCGKVFSIGCGGKSYLRGHVSFRFCVYLFQISHMIFDLSHEEFLGIFWLWPHCIMGFLNKILGIPFGHWENVARKSSDFCPLHDCSTHVA